MTTLLPHRLVLAALTAAFFVGAVACSDETGDKVEDAAESAVDDATELAARAFAKEQGEEAFKNAGQELKGDLTCKANADTGLTKVTIRCTGTTKKGGKAVLKGTTSEFPGQSFTELKGNFTGTVDGKQVFQTDELGG
jgi:hypothetical protein